MPTPSNRFNDFLPLPLLAHVWRINLNASKLLPVQPIPGRTADSIRRPSSTLRTTPELQSAQMSLAPCRHVLPFLPYKTENPSSGILTKNFRWCPPQSIRVHSSPLLSHSYWPQGSCHKNPCYSQRMKRTWLSSERGRPRPQQLATVQRMQEQVGRVSVNPISSNSWNSCLLASAAETQN